MPITKDDIPFDKINFDEIPTSKSDLEKWVDKHGDKLDDIRELWLDLDVKVLSAVENPAHNSKVVRTKSDGSKISEVTALKSEKYAEDKNIIVAPAMVANEKDKDGDVPPDFVVEEAAHNFLRDKKTDSVDVEHETPRNAETSLVERGTVVESWILDDEKEYEGYSGDKTKYGNGDWMVAIELDDDVYDKFESGEYEGLSIMGVPKKKIEYKSSDPIQSNNNNIDMDNIDIDIDYEKLAEKVAAEIEQSEQEQEQESKEQEEEETEEKDDPCWDGYEMVGMKPDPNGDGMVPNCVPADEASEDEKGIGVDDVSELISVELSEEEQKELISDFEDTEQEQDNKESEENEQDEKASMDKVAEMVAELIPDMSVSDAMTMLERMDDDDDTVDGDGENEEEEQEEEQEEKACQYCGEEDCDGECQKEEQEEENKESEENEEETEKSEQEEENEDIDWMNEPVEKSDSEDLPAWLSDSDIDREISVKEQETEEIEEDEDLDWM